MEANESSYTSMLPQVPISGPILRKKDSVKIDSEEDDDILKSIERTNRAMTKEIYEYVTNDDTISIDSVIEESIKDDIINFKTKVSISRKLRVISFEIAMMKFKLKLMNRKKTDSMKITEIKREIIKKEKEKRSLTSELTQEEKTELKRIEKEAEKQIEKDFKDVEAEMDKEMKDSDDKNISKKEETTKESCDDILNKIELSLMEKSEDEDNKKVSPELKRLDEIRGKISDLERKISDTKDRLKETGESIYEKKIKGLTEKLDKAKSELNKKEKELEKTEEVTEGFMDKLKSMKEKNDLSKRKASLKKEIDDLKKKRSEGKISDLDFSQKTNELLKKFNQLSSETLSNIKEDTEVTEAANMEDEIKPIVDKLNDLGFKVKYASPGHKDLRKKEDSEPDGVYYGKLYSDARIMFDDKYDFPEAPEYWHWREVDGCSYLDISPLSYNEKNGKTPDEAFAEWKENYMKSLRDFVDILKKDNKEEVKEMTMDDIFNSSFDRFIIE